MRRTPPRLITELIQLTTADGRSLSELANELQVDETTLMQYRSGRRPISMRSYARIVRRFAEHRLIRDLAFHYAAVEYHAEPEKQTEMIQTALPPAAVRTLTQYVEHFAEESVRGGRGLCIIGGDHSVSAAARLVAQLFGAARIPICLLAANRKPAASETRNALAAPVLVVERIDFLCDDVATLISRRSDLVRPTITTSTREIETISDPYVRRILASTTKLLAIEASTPNHDHVPIDLHAAS